MRFFAVGFAFRLSGITPVLPFCRIVHNNLFISTLNVVRDLPAQKY
jgi:hypothetical protein